MSRSSARQEWRVVNWRPRVKKDIQKSHLVLLRVSNPTSFTSERDPVFLLRQISLSLSTAKKNKQTWLALSPTTWKPTTQKVVVSTKRRRRSRRTKKKKKNEKNKRRKKSTTKSNFENFPERWRLPKVASSSSSRQDDALSAKVDSITQGYEGDFMRRITWLDATNTFCEKFSWPG